MKPSDDQFADLRSKQSPHDPSNLEACPDCGAASIMAKDATSRSDALVRMHRVDRGNGYYGYDVAKHDKDGK